jgi:8-oxo-dGTP diphosphatase
MPHLTFIYCPRCATALIEKEIHDVRRLFCPECQYVHYPQPKLVALVVIEYEEKLLLLKRNIEPARGLWNFCGGYIELGETVQEAVIREAKEEANIDIQLDKLIGIYGGEEGSNVVAAFHAHLPGNQISHLAIQAEEVSEFAFFAWEELPPLAFPVHYQILRDWKAIKL